MKAYVKIPFATPSLNKTLKWTWRQNRKFKRECMIWIKLRLKKAGFKIGDFAGKHKRTVIIKRYSAGRLDHDNFVGGCKLVVDALKECGLIVDDSPSWVEVQYEQQKTARGHAWTDIEIRASMPDGY